jgi:hypothetical protein
MSKVSKDSAAHLDEHGIAEDRHEDIDGYTVNFVSFRQDVDASPLLKGLPGDSCPCPDWGFVLKGRLTYRFADREEVFEAVDAFYLPPGHVPLAKAGNKLVQFSPADQLREVDAIMLKNVRSPPSRCSESGARSDAAAAAVPPARGY